MSTDRTVSLHVPRYALWILGVLLVGPWIVFGTWIAIGSTSRLYARDDRALAQRARSSASIKQEEPVHSGPWGDLEVHRILIEPPEEFILANYTTPKRLEWIFKGYTETALSELWHSAGLTPAQLAFVVDPANHTDTPGQIVLHPTPDFILHLTPEARARIYIALAAFPENFSQANPFRLRSTIASGWLANAELPDDVVALTKKLFYPRGSATCFSDENIVLATLTDRDERVRYIKALSRKSGLLVYLNIKPGQNVDRLVAYWARGGRSKDLKPLLQSLARLPNGGRIDILHLLPRVPRLLTYTYPLPSNKPEDANHDCHWTAFNFQNDEPDERFSDIDNVRKALMQDYYPVPGEPMLGDIIMFVRQDGVVLHSCVYIADDIVFTKNGPAYSIPWLLAPLADVQAFYADDPAVEMRRFRAKNL